MIRQITKPLVLMFLSFLFAACDREKAADSDKVSGELRKAALGQAAPDFVLKDQSSNPVSLSDFRGKVLVLEWINLDCPFVQRHYREGTFRNMALEYKPRGVAWIAINSTHYAKPASNREWHQKHQLPYPILDDSAGKVGRLYEAKTTPHMLIIDQEGRLAYSGGIDDDAAGNLGDRRIPHVRLALEDLLAGNTPRTPQTKPYG